MEQPDWLMGRHTDDPDELVRFTKHLLANAAGVPFIGGHVGLTFEHSGEVRAYRDSATNLVTILVPLAHLHRADVTTDDLQTCLAPVSRDRLHVHVAPPDHE